MGDGEIKYREMDRRRDRDRVTGRLKGGRHKHEKRNLHEK